MPPESHNHRVVEVLKISPQWIAKILGELNLTASGDIEVPEEGRIASNLIIPTNEAGSVMLRFYPEGCQSTKLETGWVDFEIEALDFLSSRGISVPAPLRFKGGHLMGEFPGIKFFAYRLLSGKPLKQSELTKETAQKAGEFLKKMISISSHFFPIHYPVPQGDVEYILKIFGEILERHSSLKDEEAASISNRWA